VRMNGFVPAVSACVHAEGHPGQARAATCGPCQCVFRITISLAACRRASESGSSGFNGSTIRTISAPRPVSTPPLEVDSRYPCLVVKKPLDSLPLAGEAGRKDPLIPAAHDDAAPIAGELGLSPRHQTRKAPEAIRDFKWRDGRLMISSRISAPRSAWRQ
jgi:hypothetical protein